MAAPLTPAQTVRPVELPISTELDCLSAQERVRRTVLGLGFSGSIGEEIILAVAELTSNLIRHAGKGTLSARPIETGGRLGIEIEAADQGPGIADVERSFTDGYSTTGSLGYGLGTVNRLMDELDVSSAPDCGTRIVCRRWLRSAPQASARSLWEAGVFTRPHMGTKENGDAFIVKEWDRQLLVGLIDGLGHGELAQRAALAAQHYVQSHYDQPLDKIFAGASRACLATRGVVMALARFDGAGHLSFAGIGNIEVRARTGAERLPFLIMRGYLGVAPINAKVESFAWKPDWMLVMHTDGLSARWQWSDFPGLDLGSPHAVAQSLMKKLASGLDDATVLAVRGRES
jgi:anti-sigma regulatory factor (Ser/Thr protein kinase)